MFRTLPHRVFLSSPGSISEPMFEQSKTLLNGRSSVKSVVVNRDLAQLSVEIPSPNDYKLSSLLKAGVPLNQLPANILNPDSAFRLRDQYGDFVPGLVEYLDSIGSGSSAEPSEPSEPSSESSPEN